MLLTDIDAGPERHVTLKSCAAGPPLPCSCLSSTCSVCGPSEKQALMPMK